jgi:hypothetical protein
MSTDRRRFLELMTLGVPATARALRRDSTRAIPSRALIDEDGEYEGAFLMELVPGVRQHLLGCFPKVQCIDARRSRYSKRLPTGKDKMGD